MKKLSKKIGAAISAAVISASCLTASASAAPVKTGNKLQISYAAETDLNNYTGWTEDSVGSRYYVNGVLQTKSRVIDGVRYKISSDGYSQGKYTGWTKSAQGRRYWKDGKLIKSDWIKTPNGEFYYADEKGYITVGWSGVTRIGGAYSYFNEKGVWDGKVYWSKSNPEAARENMLTEKVRVKIKPVQTVNDADKKWSKKEKQYLENNSTYELEIPLAVADTFKVGDTVIVKSTVTRGEKKNGVYDYHLIVSGWQPLVYAGKIGSYSYYEIADINQDGVFDEREYAEAIEQRLELFNSLFLVRNDKVMLDRMFQVLGLSWEEIKENQEFIDYVEDCHDGVYHNIDEEAYGLFGGYNRLDEETGKYVFRDGMSKKELIDLMKKVIADVLASYKEDEETESDTDYFDWVSHSGGFWLEATVEEIPSVS